jgi:hypothetical protein
MPLNAVRFGLILVILAGVAGASTPPSRAQQADAPPPRLQPTGPPAPAVDDAAEQTPAPMARSGRVVQDFAAVRTGPGPEQAVVWRLYEGTQLAVTGEGRDGSGARWHRIRLWNSHDGWLEDAAVSFEPYPPPPPTAGVDAPAGPCGPRQSSRSAPTPQPLDARATVVKPAPVSETPDGEPGPRVLPVGSAVLVYGWTMGAEGRVRYRVSGDAGAGWAAPGTVALTAADPLTRRVNGRPIVEPLHGLGVWFTLDSREHGAEAGTRVAQAARANGLTHLYVEVATSPGGFFGARWLDDLLPAARAAGVRVIGSVYTCLDDVAADLALSLAVARYRTPDGLALDGLTADIEETLVAENVQAYGELLRHHLGDDALLVATVYPAEGWWASRYPWAALVASWSAVAPMTYWRMMAGRMLTLDEIAAYMQRNVVNLRTLTGRPDLPVEVLGQLFELGRPRLLGPDPPSPAEIEAAARAARDGGAVGITYFDWTRATPGQWEALAAFRW